MVERQPSKLKVAGSSLVSRSKRIANLELNKIANCWSNNSQLGQSEIQNSANVAQLVEHIHGKDEVASSILAIGSEKRKEQFPVIPALG